HEDHHQERARDRGVLAGLDRIEAKPGSDDALLDHRELCRQCAGAEQDGKVVGALDGEITGDLTRPAEDRFADHRRRYHFVIEYDGEGTSDIVLRGAPELARAGAVELEVDDRLAGALIE